MCDEISHLDVATQKNVRLWLEGQYDPEVKEQIRHLLKEHPEQIVDAFYTHLTFGTGGLRGLMGIGPNRMNVYTVRTATQGLANYIHKQAPSLHQKHAVCIGYDSRKHSAEFAQEAAKVLAGNHIQVYLFHDLRPSSLVSFACRYYHCAAGIMITASHNPPTYNGYKVYGSDGGQVVSPHDRGIIAEVIKIIDPSYIKRVSSLSHPFIQKIGTEVDSAYIQSIAAWQNDAVVNHREGSHLKIIYTSLHGTGSTIVPQALQAWGFDQLTYVASQMIPDGAFPSVQSPNPEELAALKMGIDVLLKTKGDILLATDPDADRVGVVVRHHNQAMKLDGNQIATLCLEHICATQDAQHRLPPQAAFIKTLGMTELFTSICQAYHRPCFTVLPGFKYIAEKMHAWETSPNSYQYLFGGEESYGYLLGTDVHDKDGVISSALIAEVALHAKLEGKTLVDKLHDLYCKYGLYQESVLALNFGETKEGKERIQAGMHRLRQSKLKDILGIPIVIIEDYLYSIQWNVALGKDEKLLLPTANVLLYWLEDNTKLMIRPSGTEPKIKIYCSVYEKTFVNVQEGITACLQRCEQFLKFIEQKYF